MLFYYTATGNSLYVARQLDPNPISIPQIINNNELSFEDETIGIVCPVFAGEMPRMVQEFLAKAHFKTDYFFWVSTYGKDDTVHAEFAEKKCSENGIKLAFATSVLMVDNYLPSFDMKDEMAADKKEDEQIARVKADIAARKTGIPKASDFGRGLYNMVQGRYKEHPEMNNGEMISLNSDACVGCGICTKVCPRGVYTVENGKAKRLRETCDFCLACAHACPQKAITLKMGEKNDQARFRHKNITLEEIIQSNQQHAWNGVRQMGMGVFQIPEDADAKKACLEAFKAGYRHIDTAHHYYNERGVGEAVRECGIPREELWITSKLWPDEYGEDITPGAVDKMLDRLGLEYLDMVLLHQQVGDYIGGWKGLEKAVAAGKVRSIGLSNFESGRLEEVLEIATIKPAVIQVECHPYFQQGALKKRIEAAGTKVECWFPLGHGDSGLINNPVVTALAEKHGKSNVQIILRWHVQEGHIIIPKSSNPVHMKENLEIFGFELSDEDMAAMRSMDKGVRYWALTLEQQEEKFLGIKLAE